MKLKNPFNSSSRNKISKNKEVTIKDEDLEWNEISPINISNDEKPEEIIEGLLPKNLYVYSAQYAYSTNESKMDYVVIALVTSLASLIGGSATITPKKNDKKWKLKPTIWAIAIGEPSSYKSPLLSAGIRPLEVAQKNILDMNNIRNIHQQQIEHELIEEQEKELKDKAKLALSNGDDAAGKGYVEELSKLKKVYHAEREIICNDLTAEALLVKLQKNPLGILIFNDEMTNLFSNFNKQGREQLRPLLLEGFNASDSKYVQERKTADKVVVESVHINILGGIQPNLLDSLIKDRIEGKGNDGFIERFQLAVFPDPAANRYVDINIDESIDKKVFDAYEIIAKLGSAEVTNFHFSSEAQKQWDLWQTRFQEDLNDQHKTYTAILIKFPALVAKLALVFHIYSEAENCNGSEFKPSSEIQLKHFLMALKWFSYLSSHSRKILGLGGLNVDLSVQSLIEKLPNFQGSFTKQQFGQKDWKHLTLSKDRNRALKVLELHGYIKLVTQPKKMYLVHPDFCK